jgi:hypothetical protein
MTGACDRLHLNADELVPLVGSMAGDIKEKEFQNSFPKHNWRFADDA